MKIENLSELEIKSQFSILCDISMELTSPAPLEEVLEKTDGFICDRCSKFYKVIPLSGKCLGCGGKIVFRYGDKKSLYANVAIGEEIVKPN